MKTLFESLSSSNVDDSMYNILVIVKPGFLDKTADIIKRFAEKGWTVGRIKTKQLLRDEAKRIYEPVKQEEWFEDLCDYMISDLTTAILFTKDKHMDSNMFKETNKLKDKIRNEFGESEMRNVMHSSDSLERLQIERGIYF